MAYEFFIALRHLKAKRKDAFISLITFISIAGVMLGVMTLIVVLSVMKGFEKDLRDKIIGANAHIVVLKLGGEMDDHLRVMDRLKKVEGVIAQTPFIYSQVMLTYQGRASGVVLKGVDVNTIGDVTSLPSRMVRGGLDALMANGGGNHGIILGEELARNLGVDIGDMIQAISPLGTPTPYGVIPLKVDLKVFGIFRFGMYEYDSSLAFTSIATAQQLLGIGGRVTGIEVKVEDIFATREIGRRMGSLLGPLYIVKDWMELNRNLFSALKLERITMFIILTLIILVAAFNIVGTLIMVVMDKSKEIAILRSMGATRRSIMKIFMIEGLTIGMVGTILGVFGGLAVNLLLSKYHFIKLPKDIYYIDFLPVITDPFIFLIVALASIIISLLATIYPSWKASTVNVIEAIRYE